MPMPSRKTPLASGICVCPSWNPLSDKRWSSQTKYHSHSLSATRFRSSQRTAPVTNECLRIVRWATRKRCETGWPRCGWYRTRTGSGGTLIREPAIRRINSRYHSITKRVARCSRAWNSSRWISFEKLTKCPTICPENRGRFRKFWRIMCTFSEISPWLIKNTFLTSNR